MDAHSAARVRIRLGTTAALGVTHLMLAVLAAFHRLAFTVNPTYEILAQVASNEVWLWLHGGTAILIFIALKHRNWAMEACAISVGIMGGWSFFNLLWGLTPERPVALAGPVLGLGMTFMAHGLVAAWAIAYKVHKEG